MSMIERLKARREEIAANNSKGLRTYKLKPGVTKFRILPDADPSKNFDRTYGKHYLKSLDGKKTLGVIDKNITFAGQPDFVRDLLFDAMRQAGDETIRNHYKDMLASRRGIFRVLVLSDSEVKPTEPQILEVSETQLDNIYAQLMIWMEANEADYDALQHVFQVEKTGAGLETKYQFSATPVKAPVSQAILDAAPDLDAWIQGQMDKSDNEVVNFLLQVHSSTGVTLDTSYLPVGALAAPAAQQQQIASNPENISAAAVTQILDDPQASAELDDTVPLDNVVDAVIEEITAATPAATEAETPAAAVAPPATGAGAEDIEAILASLA